MKISYLTPALLVAAALLSACSTTPTKTRLLEQTRSDFSRAQSSPNVNLYAPLELKQAAEAMDLANAASTRQADSEKVDKLASVAKQKIALSQEVTKQKMAEAEIANAGKERDRIRLDQRTAEANQANAKAQQAQLATQAAQADAAQAQRKSMEAQADTAQAQRKTEEAQARTAQLEAQLSELAAKKTERGLVITLGDVLFGTDLARLNPDGMRTTSRLATVLQQNPQRRVLVEGFTDSTGNSAHNLDLSERRANAVRSALMEQGVAQERIAIRGYGESFPVAANDTVSNRQLNRRVEIVLSDDSGRTTPR